MPDQRNTQGRLRWTICGLLFAATTINYIDRQVIGLLKPVLQDEFHWTESDYAMVVMAFNAAYAIGLFLSGRLIDRVGTRVGYAISVAFWSLAAMMHAGVTSTLGFLGVRSMLGLGEGGNFPRHQGHGRMVPQKRAGAGYGNIQFRSQHRCYDCSGAGTLDTRIVWLATGIFVDGSIGDHLVGGMVALVSSAFVPLPPFK